MQHPLGDVLILSVPANRAVKFTAAFSYVSFYYYNSISIEIRSLPSLFSFKRAARSFILIHFP